ncbi:hypothetical protein P43SY_002450 [Pythium insidiosum]|uniref:PCI domain-containing protein n=1 Tax=Pythium insidiosum TaxID=114742 RepID=A0AAD5M406_PYTIN|nr:hypothetical protein P43SY_002450 [Pythium insidiosum]
MSDSEEYEYEYDSDEQYNSDEQLEDADGEGNEERNAAIELENTFYEAEDFRQRGDYASALEYFERVVTLERDVAAPENSKWSFQAYQNIVKLAVSSSKWDAMVSNYQAMLQFLPYVTRNESTESISSILDVVSSAAGADSAAYVTKVCRPFRSAPFRSRLVPNARLTACAFPSLLQMYEVTLERLQDLHNERLWFSMNVKLGRLYLDMGQFKELRLLLNQLYAFCQTPDGVPDASKATMLLDVYALDIQLCGATKNSKKLREIYPKTLDLDAAVADPRIMGVIREEGGKMYLEEQQWMQAYNEFFESFRNYQEAGHTRATQCLKYVVLANMLASSDINPFDSREAKVYQDVEEIGAMLLLRGAYEANDVLQFERILKNPKYKLLSDPIMTKYLSPLLRNIRCQVMKSHVRPYRVMQLASLAAALNVSREEAEEIAVHLIQSHELRAKIHQPRGLLVLDDHSRSRESCKMYDAIDRWAKALDSVHSVVAARISQQ